MSRSLKCAQAVNESGPGSRLAPGNPAARETPARLPLLRERRALAEISHRRFAFFAGTFSRPSWRKAWGAAVRPRSSGQPLAWRPLPVPPCDARRSPQPQIRHENSCFLGQAQRERQP